MSESEMRPRKGQQLTLEISDLAYGGKGVARHDNFVIFAGSAVPGDTVEVEIEKVRGSYAEAKVVNVVNASPSRVNPVCEHFGYCGGCKWQHLDYAAQKKYKEDQLRQALIHIGGLKDPPIEPIIGAYKIYYYRNKMEFSFHLSESRETLLGLHRAGRFQDIFQLNKCHLQSELSNEIVKFVRQRSSELGLPPYHIMNHSGYLRFLVIREGKFTGETLVNFVTGAGEYPSLKVLAGEIARLFQPVKSVTHTVNLEKANIARGQKETTLYGSDHIYEKLGEYKYRISAGSFFQTNSYQAQRLYDLALELAEPVADENMLDLYSGTGTIAIYFSGLVGRVTGVESVPDAVKDALANMSLNSVGNCEFIVSDVNDFLKRAVGAGEKYDLVVLDPPRAGLHPEVMQSLLSARPGKIVYISCNPATLARDVKEFSQGGYSLDRAVPVDQFPQTFHIEAACRLTLR
jgi:23S rRNA (uracil1939-C5)-methyltransferase